MVVPKPEPEAHNLSSKVMAYSRDAFPRDYRDRLEQELERKIREGLDR